MNRRGGPVGDIPGGPVDNRVPDVDVIEEGTDGGGVVGEF